MKPYVTKVWLGLTRGQAMRIAWPRARKAGRRTFARFSYDRASGWAVFS